MKAIRMLFVIAVAVALGSTTRAQIDFAGAGGHARAQAFISPQLSTVDTNSEENSLRLTANEAVTNDQTIANGTSVVIGDANATGASLTVTASGNTLCRGTRTGNPDVDRLTQGMAEASYSVAFSATQRCSYALSATVKYSSTDIASDPSLFNNRAFVSLTFSGANAFTNIFITVSDAGGERTKTLTSRGFIPANAFARLSALGETRGMSAPVASSATSWSVTLTVVASPELPGTDIHWTDTSGGSFGDTANWLPTQIPVKNDTEADTAIFDKGTSFTVDLSLPPPAAAQQFAALASASDPTVERIVVSHAAPIITGGTLTADALDVDEPSLIVEDGGFLTLVNCTLQCRHGAIGDGAGGGVEVTGKVGQLIGVGQLTIGTGGRGELDVTRGGFATNATVIIGGGPPTAGVVDQAMVSDDDSLWITGNMLVGRDRPGRVVVANGCQVVSDQVVIRNGQSGRQNIESTVTGQLAPTAWSIRNLQIGDLSEGHLNVIEGGFLAVTRGLEIGNFSGNLSTLQVSGYNAARDFASRANVGDGCTVGDGFHRGGQLSISDGGQVQITEGLFIGSETGGGVFVSGFNHDASQLNVTHDNLQTNNIDDSVYVGTGTGGEGFLRVEDNGVVNCSTNLVVGDSDGVGRLDAEGGGGVFVGGQLIIGDTGTGTVNVKDPSKLQVEGETVIGVKGALTGDGAIFVNGGLHNSGVFSPGSSPGTISLHGDVEQDENGLTVIEVAGTASNQFDQVNLTGNATLGGTLRLQFMNGFAPKTGNVFNFLNVTGAISNDFTTVDVEGLAPGAQFTIGFNNGVYSATALNDATALQTVSIKGGKTAKEKKGKLRFTIRRTGSKTDLASPLTVNYRVGGTAENGIDYALLPGSVTIPARKKSVKLTVPVINDLDVEGPETVELTILPGSDYTHSLLNKASMTILDDD